MKTSVTSPFRHPAAFIPLLMSVAAFAVLAIHLLISGAARESDEGTAAHVFQLLLVGQLPVVAYYVATANRRAPGGLLLVLGMQLMAAGLALAPVALLGL
jgi:hypothetical protein